MGTAGSHSAVILTLFASRFIGFTLPYFVRNISKTSQKFVITHPIRFLSVDFLYASWIAAGNIFRRVLFILLMFLFLDFCACQLSFVCYLSAGVIFAVRGGVSVVGRGGTYGGAV